MFDLIIHNGRVVDYKNHLDQVTDIAVKDGRIASIGTALSELLGVAYTQIRNPDSNLSLLGRS